MVPRALESVIEQWLFRGKVIILYGPRQSGKTTLAKAVLKKHGDHEAYYNCEVPSVRAALSDRDPGLLKRVFGHKKLVVLDEAQHLPEIGLVLKLLVDTFPDLQILATGSSSFDLASKASEPLTGRALQFLLLPFSFRELRHLHPPLQLDAQLTFYLRYGLYPEIALSTETEARILLDDLTSKYLFKDILAFEQLKSPEILAQLLQLLAFQIGSEVSYHELGKSLHLDSRTVERYIELLEKSFVLFRLRPFSRNLRKEIRKKNKIYFFDLGIRNSIVQQYQPIEMRPDKGALWENFLLAERYKLLQVAQIRPNRYFWRTHDQQEIDYLEEVNGRLIGYEFKWKHTKRKVPPAFKKGYPQSEVRFIDRSNYRDFLDHPGPGH